MSTLESLSQNWNDTITQIAALGPMRPGNVSGQKAKYRKNKSFCRDVNFR